MACKWIPVLVQFEPVSAVLMTATVRWDLLRPGGRRLGGACGGPAPSAGNLYRPNDADPALKVWDLATALKSASRRRFGKYCGRLGTAQWSSIVPPPSMSCNPDAACRWCGAFIRPLERPS